MSPRSEVRVTVLAPRLDGEAADRTGSCVLLVESSLPLPIAPYAGTVRITGIERKSTGAFACRLLKRYTVERESETDAGVRYVVRVDLADEGARSGVAYTAPGTGVRRPDEPIEVICKRIAGVFGRACEGFRPPSVIVELGD